MKKIRAVFVPGGQPTVTYVDRAELQLEKKLRTAISRGYSLIAVTGSTKSGKTVLCRRILGDKAVYVEGGQIKSTEQFWRQVASKLGLADTEQASLSTSTETMTGKEIEGGVKPMGIGGSVTATDSESKTREAAKSAIRSNDFPSTVHKALLQQDLALVIDDFHYLQPAVQGDIVRALKSYIFDGLTAVVIAVPHRAFDPVTVEREMDGRFSHIETQPWSEAEIQRIPEQGFAELEIASTQKEIETIAQNSFGNPLLCQELCWRVCVDLEYEERQPCGETISLVGFDFSDSFQEVATDKGFPSFRKLKKGPQARKDRQERKYRDGRSGDIYGLVLEAIARNGPKERNTYDEIRTQIREIAVEQSVPQKHEVSASLSQMTKIAREEITGEPPVDWVKDEDTLIITDPFLMFFMKWGDLDYQPGTG